PHSPLTTHHSPLTTHHSPLTTTALSPGGRALAADSGGCAAASGSAPSLVDSSRRRRHHTPAHRELRTVTASSQGSRHHPVREGRGRAHWTGDNRPARQPRPGPGGRSTNEFSGGSQTRAGLRSAAKRGSGYHRPAPAWRYARRQPARIAGDAP